MYSLCLQFVFEFVLGFSAFTFLNVEGPFKVNFKKHGQ